MPGVPDKAAAQGHVYITEKPYLHHQLGVPRAPILA